MATLAKARTIVLPTFRPRRLLRELTSTAGVTAIGLAAMLLFLLPLGYMIATAFKSESQFSAQNAPLWPANPALYNYQGHDYPLYEVPTDQGVKTYVLIQGYREDSDLLDPQHPELGIVNITGRWRTWNPVYEFSPTTANFVDATNDIDFVLLFRNTFALAIIGTIGTLISCIMVAYGFARFRLPGKNILFVVLMATIMLPPQATIIPMYIFFTKLGWVGTWLPLLVPAFFANAYDVFLLRQYMLTIPRDLDEAAMIDGATPLQTLVRVIIPQAIPAITAVTLFHFFYEWNRYFEPLVYLIGREDLFPISLGIARFVQTYGIHYGRAAATAAITLILPAVLFFLAQRQFMQGVVITGVEK